MVIAARMMGTLTGQAVRQLGVSGVPVPDGSLSLGSTFTDAPGGTAHWTFTGGTNYLDESGDVAIAISKADATVSVNGYTGTYDGNAHGASGTAKGVKGECLSGLNLGSSFTNVPGGTANWVFTDVTGNYYDKSGSATITITIRTNYHYRRSSDQGPGRCDRPALTYKITEGSLVNGDSFSGALSRDLGEEIGTYAITQGDLLH